MELDNPYNSILVGLLCLISFIFIFIRPTSRSKVRFPPSPRSLPIIGHLHLLGQIPHQSLHTLSTQYGPIIHLFFGSKPCVLVSSPDIAAQFLKTNEFSFLNRPTRININYLTYGSADFTFAPYGPYWKFLKKLCITELLGGRTLDLLVPVRKEEIGRFIERIHTKAVAAEPEPKEVNIGEELLRLMNNIISRMILRRRSCEEDGENNVSGLVEEMCELAGKLNFSDMIWFCKNLDLQGFGKRVKDVRNRYDEMMEKIIKDHEEMRRKKKSQVGEEEEEGDHRHHDDDGGGAVTVRDLLDVLLDVYEDKSAQIKLTRDNIKAFVMNLFGAGTDTSAKTTEWALAELINNPKVLSKARKEIEEVIGKKRIIEESDTPKLPYLQAIVKETLRLHPTAPLLIREATEACSVNGYDIAEKTRLIVNLWAIGRDPKHWENPLQFKPERFLQKRNDFDNDNQLMMPFGSGRRSCPGASLALKIIPTVVGALIQCFEWKLLGNASVLDMEEAPGISLPRAHPLVLIPVLRCNPFPSI